MRRQAVFAPDTRQFLGACSLFTGFTVAFGPRSLAVAISLGVVVAVVTAVCFDLNKRQPSPRWMLPPFFCVTAVILITSHDRVMQGLWLLALLSLAFTGIKGRRGRRRSEKDVVLTR